MWEPGRRRTGAGAALVLHHQLIHVMTMEELLSLERMADFIMLFYILFSLSIHVSPFIYTRSRSGCFFFQFLMFILNRFSLKHTLTFFLNSQANPKKYISTQRKDTHTDPSLYTCLHVRMHDIYIFPHTNTDTQLLSPVFHIIHLFRIYA